MSRIILKNYDNGEQQFVVGWDRPCASYFWQAFRKEPEEFQGVDDKWYVKDSDGNIKPEKYDTQAEAGEAKWEDWEEMIDFKGYDLNELPTMQAFMDSLPEVMKPFVTEEVMRLLKEHSTNPPDVGSIVVDMTTSNVVMGSYKVEVLTYGETKWASNALRFATEEEAKAAALDLAGRWTMLQEWRIASSMDPVNYKWREGRAVAV